jgi:DNA-binding MarR family transcriptional regulator
LPPLLRRAWFSLNQAFRRRIAHLELTPDQFTVLRTLCEAGSGGLSQRALTGLMSSDPNTITSLLDRMEEAGLVRREADPADRRVRRVRVTPVGDRRFRVARALALELQAEVLAVLPARGRETFLARLEKVAEAAREAAGRLPRTPARGG